MTDLLILHAPDKKTSAEAIAQASRSAGYVATLSEVAAPESVAAQIRAVPAAVLIWSRPLVTAARDGNWLAGLRQLRNLIEVSTDGIEPDTPGEAGRVVLLSGWRGQPHHLGWQRFLDELKRLAAPKSTSLPLRRQVRMEDDPPRQASAAGPRAAGAVRRFMLPALALGAIAAVSVVAWNGSGGADRQQSAPGQGPVAAPAPQAAPQAAPEALPPEAAPLPEPSGSPMLAEVPAPAPPPEPGSPSLSSRVEPALEAGVARRATRSQVRAKVQKARPASASGPVKRYSRRNSKTMRLFCARSGRGTPQCRTFLRSTRS